MYCPTLTILANLIVCLASSIQVIGRSSCSSVSCRSFILSRYYPRIRSRTPLYRLLQTTMACTHLGLQRSSQRVKDGGGIMLALNDIHSVVVLYEKIGGKSGRYASVTQTSNIAATSYIDLQIFVQGSGRRIINLTSSTVMFGENHFTKIPSQQSLVLLNEPSHPNPAGTPTG
ncbi:hypothetical protein PM082_018388 [Marasmius tenuissimus]|nr:hypothetical protein PM082_018388 [Marasmius tenuissimus]